MDSYFSYILCCTNKLNYVYPIQPEYIEGIIKLSGGYKEMSKSTEPKKYPGCICDPPKHWPNAKYAVGCPIHSPSPSGRREDKKWYRVEFHTDYQPLAYRLEKHLKDMPDGSHIADVLVYEAQSDDNKRFTEEYLNSPDEEDWEHRLDTSEFGFDIDGAALKKFIKGIVSRAELAMNAKCNAQAEKKIKEAFEAGQRSGMIGSKRLIDDKLNSPTG